MKGTSKNQLRQIRVFISSTFRDMQAERDLLVKKIFPQLRKLCEQRSVAWTEVDLRWGITSEQAAEGKVLPLCLDEIQRCRPYFIGLLGERYGWVPMSVPEELIQRQPWLREHLDCSVTELEIMHGVFAEEQMHAYFYFRDRKYLEEISEGERKEFEEEDPDAAGRLEKLKSKIRDGQNSNLCNLRENYFGPEDLSEWILEDFTNLIDELYPKDETPDALDQEAARHEAHARGRRLAFIGREDLIERLNAHARGTKQPLVLAGESGCGKSSLIAEWVGRWRESNSDDLIIQHYIGSTSSSADWQSLVRRILGELKRSFNIEDELPQDDDALRVALADWAGKVSGRKRIVLILDALNQLEDEDAAKQLGWLPDYFPPNFRVVLSSLPGPCFALLRQREFHEIKVPLFTAAEIEQGANAYFRIFGKTPTAKLLYDLQSTPTAHNPLCLRSVLDELRQFGRHDELQNKTQEYLSAPNPAALFDRIITRWDNDFGQHAEYPEIVRNALSLIVCSRFGLSEAEILDLLGRNGDPVPHHFWTPFYLAAENSLSLNDGLLRVGHEYLQRAIETRWLTNSETEKECRLAIAEYFQQREVGPRTAAELPWQLRMLGDRDRLRQSLLQIPLALAINIRNDGDELRDYWIGLSEEDAMGQFYLQSFNLWSENKTEIDILDTATQLGRFLHAASLDSHAEPLFRESLRLSEKLHGANSTEVAFRLNDLGRLLNNTNRRTDAEAAYRRAVEIMEVTLSPDDIELTPILGNLANLLDLSERSDEAEGLHRRALAIQEKVHGPSHPSVATTLNNLGFLLFTTEGRVEEGVAMFWRALKIYEQFYGPDDRMVALVLNNIGEHYRVNERFEEAEPIFKRSVLIHEKAYGPKHPLFANTLGNYALLLLDTNQLKEAEKLMIRTLRICELAYVPNHPQTEQKRKNLSAIRWWIRIAMAKRVLPVIPIVGMVFFLFLVAIGFPRLLLFSAFLLFVLLPLVTIIGGYVVYIGIRKQLGYD